MKCIYFSVDEKQNKHKIDLLSKSQVQNESLSDKVTANSSSMGMDNEEFRRHGKEMIDYIADYLSNIRLKIKNKFSFYNFLKIIVNVV